MYSDVFFLFVFPPTSRKLHSEMGEPYYELCGQCLRCGSSIGRLHTFVLTHAHPYTNNPLAQTIQRQCNAVPKPAGGPQVPQNLEFGLVQGELMCFRFLFSVNVIMNHCINIKRPTSLLWLNLKDEMVNSKEMLSKPHHWNSLQHNGLHRCCRP